jgi:hypothetical protein
MPKIALIRIIYKGRDFGEYEAGEWIKEHITDFAEVSDKEYDALRFFTAHYNNKNRNERQYVIIKDERYLLPKTIAEALELAEKQEKARAEEEKKAMKKIKEKEKLKKKRQVEKLAAEVAKLEEYKAKLDKMKRGK